MCCFCKTFSANSIIWGFFFIFSLHWQIINIRFLLIKLINKINKKHAYEDRKQNILGENQTSSKDNKGLGCFVKWLVCHLVAETQTAASGSQPESEVFEIKLIDNNHHHHHQRERENKMDFGVVVTVSI